MKGITFDVQLTNYAHGIAPDFSSSLAELLAPQCVAPAASGQYIKFDDDEAFRYIETRRAQGGDMAMIDFPTTAPTFSCEPHALGIGTDAFERERVGDAGLQMLREAKTRTLVSRNALSREKRVFDAYANGTSAEAGLGTWTDKTKDPVDELNTMLVKLATQTGRTDIHLVIGINALQQFAKHPNVLTRFRGGNMGYINVTGAVMANLLLIPTTPHVATMPIALEKTGKTASKTIIAGSKIYALITQKSPSPFDPSAAKTFTTTLGQVQGVGTVEKPPFSEITYIAWSEDIEMTGTQCVVRMDVATGAIS